MMRAITLAAAVLAGGCSTDSAETLQTTRVELTQQQRKLAEEGVRKVLKDPESARFGEMNAGKDVFGVVWICGKVNSKNSFGGYVGDEVFAGTLINAPAPAFSVVDVGGRAPRECDRRRVWI